jgi:hypothetical protein
VSRPAGGVYDPEVALRPRVRKRHRPGSPPAAQAGREIIRWIEGLAERGKLHSSIAYPTPDEKEAAWHRLAA